MSRSERAAAMRAARQKAGYTQEYLAYLSGLPRVTITRLENDIHQGHIDTIEILADALGISIDEYVGHEVRRKEN